MSGYKRQFLNLYAPSNSAATKFCVQQKADEALISREDKKIRFYCPDFVIRKKEALAGDEEDLSVFDEFVAQKADYTGQFTSTAQNHAVLATTVAATQVTVTSNKVSSDNAQAAEVSARTSADGALSSSIVGNKSLQDAGFVSATNARAADKAELAQDIQDEATARAGGISGLQTQISSILSNSQPDHIDSLSEVVAQMATLSSEDSTLAGLIASQGLKITALEGIVNQLLNAQ